MTNQAPERFDSVPLPPADAQVFTTACAYCTVACGYKVYRWPVGRDGTATEAGNALRQDFPHADALSPWASPTQHRIGFHEGRPHNFLVVPDFATEVVNPQGNHSIRGGTLAERIFNPDTLTRERLQYPQVRINGRLQRVSWDFALDVMAQVSKHVLEKHGEHAWGMKTYSYEYFENTYAIAKLVDVSIGTPVYAPHDKPQAAEDAAGLDDAGINSFAASFEDWRDADVAFLSGVDPYETKTTLFTSWMMNGPKLIFVTPHKTMGVAYGLENGGLWLPIIPGTDTVLHLALARLIIENNWQDQAFIDRWVANKWEIESGYGRGTRNTRWQWRTTMSPAIQSDWEDYKRFIMAEEASKLENAAQITGLSADLIRQTAEMIAKPRPDGTRPKTSFMLEKGNYWSNNYMNTASLAAVGLICGAGNRPGQVISRGGGHQRGWMSAGGGRWWLSPEKFPGRRKRALNVDRWVMDGHVRFMWTIGLTWYPAMVASQALADRVHELTAGHAIQPIRLDARHVAERLIARADAGGMVLVDSDIYPVDPLNTHHADIVLPAAGWGEESFTRCNSERRLRHYAKFNDAPGEAKPDWWAIAQFAQRMGYQGYEWRDSNDIFEESSRFSRGNVLSYHVLVTEAKQQGKRAHDFLAELGTTGIQTPVRLENGRMVGTKRLHDPANSWSEIEGVTNDARWLYEFDTHSGKALLLKTSWANFPGWRDFYDAVKPRAEKGELWITNGRVNETWQSGFDDLRKPYLLARWPFPHIVLHPDDAQSRGIESGDFVEAHCDEVFVQTGAPLGVEGADLTFTRLRAAGHIRVAEGRVTFVALVSDEMRPGVAKAQFNMGKAMANALVPAVPDPITGNYRYKLGRGSLRRVGPSPWKTNLAEMSLRPRPIV